jgi:hypothetical protein
LGGWEGGCQLPGKVPQQSRRDAPNPARGGADARHERGATPGCRTNATQKPEWLALIRGYVHAAIVVPGIKTIPVGACSVPGPPRLGQCAYDAFYFHGVLPPLDPTFPLFLSLVHACVTLRRLKSRCKAAMPCAVTAHLVAFSSPASRWPFGEQGHRTTVQVRGVPAAQKRRWGGGLTAGLAGGHNWDAGRLGLCISPKAGTGARTARAGLGQRRHPAMVWCMTSPKHARTTMICPRVADPCGACVGRPAEVAGRRLDDRSAETAERMSNDSRPLRVSSRSRTTSCPGTHAARPERMTRLAVPQGLINKWQTEVRANSPRTV